MSGKSKHTYGNLDIPGTYKDVSTANELNSLLNFRYKGTQVLDSRVFDVVVEDTLAMFTCTFSHINKKTNFLLGIKMNSATNMEDTSEALAFPRVSILIHQKEHGLRKIVDIDDVGVPIHILEAYTKLVRLVVDWRTKGDIPYDSLTLNEFNKEFIQ